MPITAIPNSPLSAKDGGGLDGSNVVYLDLEVSVPAWEGMGKPEIKVCGYSYDKNMAMLKGRELEMLHRDESEMEKVYVVKVHMI